MALFHLDKGQVAIQRKEHRVELRSYKYDVGGTTLWLSAEQARDLAEDIKSKADAAFAYRIAGPQPRTEHHGELHVVT